MIIVIGFSSPSSSMLFMAMFLFAILIFTATWIVIAADVATDCWSKAADTDTSAGAEVLATPFEPLSSPGRTIRSRAMAGNGRGVVVCDRLGVLRRRWLKRRTSFVVCPCFRL